MEPALLLNSSVLLTMTIMLTPILLPLMATRFQNSPSHHHTLSKPHS